MLLLARSLQGLASSCLAVAGMGMVAKMYQNDHERAEKMGLTMSGIATGVLIGYPMGGILFDLVGEAFPFAIITLGTALILGKLRRVDFE